MSDDAYDVGESQTVEWKRSLALRDEGLQSLCAMVNSDAARGTVVFGISPDGSIAGVEPGNLDTAQQSISRAIGSGFEPRLQFTVGVEKVQGKHLVLVSAERNADIPMHEFKGRAFIREGTVTRRLTLGERQSLQRRRDRDLHPGPWTCDRCGSWVGNLLSVEITALGVRKTYACPCGGEFWPSAYL